MKRIALFGGTGKTGRLFMRLALEAGYKVVAYVRNPAKLNIDNENLEIVKGELGNLKQVEEVVRRSDYVISFLGPLPKDSGREITEGTAAILKAMVKYNKKRVIITSTSSAVSSEDRFSMKFKLLIMFIKRLLPNVYRDIVNTAEIVKNSETDWTIIRLPMLNDRSGNRKVKSGFVGKRKFTLKLSREDLATFVLEELENRAWTHKMPFISN